MHNAPNQSLFHSRYLVGRTLLWQIKVLTCSQLYFSMAFWWNPVRLLQHQDYPFLLAIVQESTVTILRHNSHLPPDDGQSLQPLLLTHLTTTFTGVYIYTSHISNWAFEYTLFKMSEFRRFARSKIQEAFHFDHNNDLVNRTQYTFATTGSWLINNPQVVIAICKEYFYFQSKSITWQMELLHCLYSTLYTDMPGETHVFSQAESTPHHIFQLSEMVVSNLVSI